MKNAFLLLGTSLLCFSSCYYDYNKSYIFSQHNQPEQPSQFTNVPMMPHDKEVKVFFQGEKLPEDPYIKVDVFDAFGGDHNATKELIKNLQQQGQYKGVDAIILMGRDNFSNTYDDGEVVQTISTQKISGLGIKFIKNIDYLDQCLKELNIVAYDKDSKSYENKATIRIDRNGNLIELIEGIPFYYHFLFNFSTQHLVDEVSTRWQYSNKGIVDGFSTVKRYFTIHRNMNKKIVTIKKNTQKYYSIDDNKAEEKKISIKGKPNTLFSIKVDDPASAKYSGVLTFKYDENRTLISKDIMSKKLGHFQQRYFYQENGLPLRYEIFKKNEAGEFKLYFQAIFKRYEMDDLEELLSSD